MKNFLDYDQFYTNSDIAKLCLEQLRSVIGDLQAYKNIIEPSAGSGAFLDLLPPHALGIDIDPKHDRVVKGDFLKWQPTAQDFIVIGNPPFGKNSSLAVSFFNKSAEFAEVIAFIVPRTFRKSSLTNRLNSSFHLQYEKILPIDSFHFPDNTKRSVPTCFQVWKKLPVKRTLFKSDPSTHPDWDWCDKEHATHAIRRVGAYAGKLIDIEKAAEASHFFVSANNDVMEKQWDRAWKKFWIEENENDPNPKWDVAGNPSLTKQELVKFYTLSSEP
jgi:hypothetical protein